MKPPTDPESAIDPELARLVAAAQAREAGNVGGLARVARLQELRERLAEESGDGLVQLAVRIPEPLRLAVREAARLAGTSAQEWVAEVLRAAVEEAADSSQRVAALVTAEIRRRWRDGIDLDAYADAVAAIEDPELANV